MAEIAINFFEPYAKDLSSLLAGITDEQEFKKTYHSLKPAYERDMGLAEKVYDLIAEDYAQAEHFGTSDATKVKQMVKKSFSARPVGSYINCLLHNGIPSATVTIFKKDLPSFEYMPQESIDKLFEEMSQDDAKKVIPYELGRFATNLQLGRGLRSASNLKLLFRGIKDYFELLETSPFNEVPSHLIVASNGNDARAYESLLGFKTLEETKAFPKKLNGHEAIYSCIYIPDALNSANSRMNRISKLDINPFEVYLH